MSSSFVLKPPILFHLQLFSSMICHNVNRPILIVEPKNLGNNAKQLLNSTNGTFKMNSL